MRSPSDPALFTDLYQLTMAQAYFREGLDGDAVFDLFVRRLGRRNVLLCAGLADVLDYLETLRFSEEALAYLGTLGLFDAAFLDHLSAFRFTGDVYAVAEGTPVFHTEPLLEVVAPIAQAQLIETFLLNQVTFQTGAASKALRVVQAARGRPVVDFGTRRMHGTDAAVKAVRAYHLAGVAATSNVLAGWTYGVPVAGTMAHSYVEAHAREEDAFRAFAAAYPGTTLLVDTYDTLEGVRRVARVVRETGCTVGAIRLDSGDLAALARDARALLDEAGLSHVRILASGNLDEDTIARLLDAGAPIDGFGVGTRMGTLADQPYLDTAYKLCAYNGRPTMKLAAHKRSLPGRKQVYRVFDGERAVRDVIAGVDEPPAGTPLLACVMRGGRRTDAGRDTLAAARERAREGLARLPGDLLTPVPTRRPFEVVVSASLRARREGLAWRLRGDG